jgi:hypothetical protein
LTGTRIDRLEPSTPADGDTIWIWSFPAVVRSGFNQALQPDPFSRKLQKVSKRFRQGFRKLPKSANFFQILSENFTRQPIFIKHLGMKAAAE